MGIRITMENKIDDIDKRLHLVEGAVEDLLNIYKEKKDVKKEKLSGKKSSKKKTSSTKARPATK